jgi:hypothetical protein
MDYVQGQVQRVSRNLMILFGIIFAYFALIAILMFGTTQNGSVDPQTELFVGVVFAIVLLVFLILFINNLQAFKNYQRSSVFKRLGKLGYGSSEEISKIVSDEMATSLKFSQKNISITSNWVIVRSAFGMQAKPLSELVWAYRQITRTNYGARWHHAVLTFSDRKQSTVSGKETEISEIITYINQKFDHVLVGYSRDWDRLFKGNYGKFIELLIQNEQERRKQKGLPPVDENEKRNRYIMRFRNAAAGHGSVPPEKKKVATSNITGGSA